MRAGGPRSEVAAVPGLAACIALALLCGLAITLRAGTGLGVPDTAAVVLAAGGALACLLTAVRARGRQRRGWAALAVACWAWGAGQLLATVRPDAPAPAGPLADVGHLTFPAAALAALCWLAPPAPAPTVLRRVLDAVAVACSVAVVAVVIAAVRPVVGPAAPAGPGGAAAAVSLARPLGDVVLLAVVVLTALGGRGVPPRWVLLGTGVLAMLVADVALARATNAGGLDGGLLDGGAGPGGGSAAQWGWSVAFGLFAVAAIGARPAHGSGGGPRGAAPGLLPYLPLAVAAGALGLASSAGAVPGSSTVALVAVLVVLALGRQYAAVRDHHDLARAAQRREVELHHLAFHDPLTGLANRALFLDRLEHALDLATRHPLPVSVVFLDLDGFKAVNDSLGHAMGDALLVGVAKRLRGALRRVDTVARLGGDEFAVLVEQGDDATVVARTLLEALRTPFPLQGRRVAVSASIGVAVAEPGQGAAQAAGLLHRADVAMYAVKTSGKSEVQIHSSAVHGTLPQRGSRVGAGPPLQRAFAAALESGGVHAVYQPVVDPLDGRIGALEALARWTHEGVDVPPDVFIPICEEAGLSEALTEVMLEHSCGQLASWSRALQHDRLRVAVNLSPTELGDADLPARVDRLLARHRLAPGQLALEITESAVPNRPSIAADVLQGLRHLGVRLALDDFGTGYSTLARLSSTPLDTVKVDRFFVADIDHDDQQRHFLRGLLELTRHLGLRTVAEGVERTGQLVALRELGCDLVQGHLIARPATVEELTPVVLAEQSLLPRGFVGAPVGTTGRGASTRDDRHRDG